MRTPRLTDERGMALAVAIFALVVIGALVAGAFYAGNLEQRTGRNSVYAAEAAQAAESGPSRCWRTGIRRAQQPGRGRQPELGTSHLARRPHERHRQGHPAQQRAVPGAEPGQPGGRRRARAGAAHRRHRRAAQLRHGHRQGGGHRHQADHVQRQRVQRHRQRLDAQGLGQGRLGNADPNCTKGADQAGIRSATTHRRHNGDHDNIVGSPKEVANDPDGHQRLLQPLRRHDLRRAQEESADIVADPTPRRTTRRRPSARRRPRPLQHRRQINWGEPRADGGLHQGVHHATSRSSTPAARSSSCPAAGAARGCCWSRATSRSPAASSSPA